MKEGLHIGKILTKDSDLLVSSTYNLRNVDEEIKLQDYTIPINSRMHGIVAGSAPSGKTLLMNKFASELSNIEIPESGKKMRVIAFDNKDNWRVLAKYTDSQRLKFNSMSNPQLMQLSLNVWKVPANIAPKQWVDGIIGIFAQEYGLGEALQNLFKDAVYEIYNENGLSPDELKNVSQKGNCLLSFSKIVNKISMLHEGNSEKKDMYRKLLDRLAPFKSANSIEYKYYSQEPGQGIDELLGNDDVIIFEGYGLETTTRNFLYAAIAFGIFKVAQSCEYGFKGNNQFETMMFIEDADQLFSTDQSGISHSILDKLYDQAAGLGIYIISITQRPSKLSNAVIANSSMVFAGKMSSKEDIDALTRKLGNEKSVEEWFKMAPTGYFLCKHQPNNELSLVQVDKFDGNKPTNEELSKILLEK